MHAREVGGVGDRRQPRLQEVGAEGHQVRSLADRVLRYRVPSERDAVRRPHRLVGERLVRDTWTRAHQPHPLVHQPAETSRLEPAHDRDAPALLAAGEGGDLVGHLLLGVVPGDGLALRQRAAEPIGMVERLQSGVTADAERAGVHRMIRVALELDHAAVAVLGDESASGRALAAHRREICRYAGDDVVGRHDIGEERSCRWSAAASRRRGAGGGDDLEERPAIHHTHPLLRPTRIGR